MKSCYLFRKVWYSAKVASVDVDSVSIRYDDDGKIEHEIPKFCDEIRFVDCRGLDLLICP